MNKLYRIIIAVFIITGFYSCKKDAGTTSDFNKYIIGKWTETKMVDTIFNNDTIFSTGETLLPIDSISSTFIFNADKTGTIELPGSLFEKFHYQISNSDLLFSSIRQFSPSGLPLSIPTDHDSRHIVKLTDSEMIFRTGVSDPSGSIRDVIYLHYKKLY